MQSRQIGLRPVNRNGRHPQRVEREEFSAPVAGAEAESVAHSLAHLEVVVKNGGILALIVSGFDRSGMTTP